MICLKSMLVYHLHGQTGWSMVWANEMHNSGLVNFILELHSPFVQITSIIPKNDSEGLKLVSKLALKKWNINFVLEYFVRQKGKTFSDVLLLLEIFHWKDPKSCVPFTF